MDLGSSKAPAPATLGAFAFAALVALGATACSTDTVSSDGESGMTTTTSGTTAASTSSSTTADDTSDSGSTGVDTDDEPNETTLTSGSFYAGPDVDFGGVPSCDPILQDCPEGEKCVPYASSGGGWDANKCVPVLGDGAAGDPCVYGGTLHATDDCGPESYCWNAQEIDGELVGECTEFCQGTQNDPECAPGTSCMMSANGSISLCVPSCDPLAQDCTPGLGCYWVHIDFNCVFTAGGEGIPLGEPCGYINDCVPGSTCMSADSLPECAGSSCCASFCELGSNQPCPQPGTECVAFFPEGDAPPEYSNVGVCMLGE